jgi:DNA-binding NarL/FixJ family response regulator
MLADLADQADLAGLGGSEACEPAALLAAWDEAAAAWAALSEPYPLALALLAGAQIALADAGPTPGAPGGTDVSLGLTGRELEVLRLVAAGCSNREIAAELFIAPKTASVHVSNILGKLGVASRGEAAAKAHALRLFDAGAPAGQ